MKEISYQYLILVDKENYAGIKCSSCLFAHSSFHIPLPRCLRTCEKLEKEGRHETKIQKYVQPLGTAKSWFTVLS